MSPHTHVRTHAALLGLFAASLTACGGGGGDNTPSPTPPVAAIPAPPAASVPAPAPAPAPAPLAVISGTVADGPLAGAVVCYDLNDNSNCEAVEPTSAPTDSDGRYRIEIDPTLAGKHRVVAIVPAGAIDKHTGAAVGTAFTLAAPATAVAGSQSVFVSPLTTLVQTLIDTTAQSTEQATTLVQTQAGLAISPLADFTAGADPAQQKAATVARLALLTMNRKISSLSAVVGQTDLSEGTVSGEQLQRAVLRDVLGALPAVAAVAADPAIRDAASPAARESALAKATDVLLQFHVTLSEASAKLAVGMSKLPLDTQVEPAAPTASLAALRYQDSANWYYRALLGTTADNTLDANGWARYYEARSRRVAGQTTTWGFNNDQARADDLHWSGSAWVDCPTGSRSPQQADQPSGFSEYGYCGNFETGVRSRSVTDIAGRTLRSVVEAVRAVPGGGSGVVYAEWGPADLALLGTATMPAGSQLVYQTNTVQSNAVAYEPRTSNEVNAQTAAVAAGGDARGGASPACSLPSSSSPATSLEEMIARNSGSPCIFGANADTGDRNESWGTSTVSIGTLPNTVTPPIGTGTYYSTTARLRVAFVGGGSNAVNFYSCLERASNFSTRNCSIIGTGTYRIDTLADGRTMEFTGTPELAQRLTYRRVFVERGGKVYHGYRTLVGRPSVSVRVNLPAANALFTQLGMPLLNPVD